MQPFRLLGHTEVHTEIAGHSYTFRRLNWQEELAQSPALTLDTKTDPRRIFLATMLAKVDGKPLTFMDALKLTKAFRAPVLERVYMIAMGSMPAHRAFSIPTLFKAPGVKSFSQKVIEEEESEAEKGDNFLEGIFGKEEVEEEREMEAAILKASDKRGAIKLNPFTQEPLEDGEEG